MRFLSILFPAAFFAVTAAAGEFSPPLSYDGKAIPGFNLLASSETQMIYLNPNYGQYGAGVIKFPKPQPAGDYRITLKITAPEENRARVGFYLVLSGGKQKQLREFTDARPGKIDSITLTGSSAEPVTGLAVKKMDKITAPSVAVGDVRVTVEPKVELPEVPFETGHEEAFRIGELKVPFSSRLEIDGKVGAGVAAGVSQYGYSVIPLGKLMPAGNYTLECDILVPSQDAAQIALYVQNPDTKAQMRVTDKLGRQAGVRKFSFSAAAPFSAIVVKKMDSAKTASVALGDFKFIMRSEARLSAAREVFRYPAPYGFRSGQLVDEVASAVAAKDAAKIKELIPSTEKWLDTAALAIDAASEWTTLRRAAAVFAPGRFDGEIAALDAEFGRVRDLLAQQSCGEAADACRAWKRRIAAFHAELNRAAGGEVNPDVGSDLFTWVKNFEPVLRNRFPEYAEPTPWRIAGPGGITLAVRAPGNDGTVESSRTANRYVYDDLICTFSVLTNVMVFDLKSCELTGTCSGIPLKPERLSDRAFLLDAPGTDAVLVLADRKMEDVKCADGKWSVRLAAPGRVGLLFADSSMNPEEIAAYYVACLDRLPQELVQLERSNGEVEQRVLDHAGRPAAFFPVSPLLELGRKAPRPVICSAAFGKTPDGRTILADTREVFSYQLPKRAIRTEYGVNVWDFLKNNPELFHELKSQGCEVIRLACGCSTEWNWERPEVMRDALLHNLKLISEAGLKCGIDMHGGWTPSKKEFGAYNAPAYRAEFLKRWTAIIKWAEPYRNSIAWYDLMNEPTIFFQHEPVKPYWELIDSTLPELRKLDPSTPFLVEVANMANPVGAWEWPERISDGNVIVGFHDYWPHVFTHQRVPDDGSSAMPEVHYPGFLPMISWQAPSWRNDDPNWALWDRWKTENISYPVLRVLAASGLPADCGEIGVVGYAKGAENSGRLWLADAFRRLKRFGVSNSVWGVHGGYVWNVPAFKDEVLKLWGNENGR